MTLELRNVTKRVGGLSHIYETSITFEPGEFNVLLGATGAGKTSLIKIMSGLERPSTGQLIVDGVDVSGLSPQRRNIALVHQFFVNYPHMNVFDNIASPLRVVGLGQDEIIRRVEEAADILQLRPMLKRRPHELSGGQQQRCALARAIVKESKAVFLDEPLANLDYKLREELRDQLPELFAGRGAVVVYATSEPAEALLLGGRTALLHQGRITQFGPTAEIYRAPADLTSAQVFSDPPINVAGITKIGDKLILNDTVAWRASGAAARLADGDYTFGVRPGQVSPDQVNDAAVKITGEVRITELSGSESVAHFRVGDSIWVSQTSGARPYRVGEVRDFFIDTSHCFYFAPDGKLAV